MAAESSRSCRSRSSAQKREIVCRHGRDPCLEFWDEEQPWATILGIQEECDFFRWADPEADSDDPHVTRMKRKVAAMKARVRDIEWKFKVAAVLGIFGWVVLFCFWWQIWFNQRQEVACVMPLKYG
ncbi:uncharacterized protein LOC107490949 [Arachis duranensis]|uniref:Uncharacterized protein LOC107490949 n=1 Tax=Arachis duranensis TaxID=130453 RepID=A0A6P4DF02_ARADU|nr:uncharacterized protein LOC107490949 [Arachis duranensis]